MLSKMSQNPIFETWTSSVKPIPCDLLDGIWEFAPPKTNDALAEEQSTMKQNTNIQTTMGRICIPHRGGKHRVRLFGKQYIEREIPKNPSFRVVALPSRVNLFFAGDE